MLRLTRKFLMANCYKKGIVRVRLRMNHDALEILCLNALRTSVCVFQLLTDQFPPNLPQLAKKATGNWRFYI